MKTRYEFADLIEEQQFKVAAEVGVYQGAFSEYLLRHTGLDKLYSIDSWMMRNSPVAIKQATSCLAHYGERSEIMHMLSEDAADHFDDGQLDFIYIDADHRARGFRRDLNAWFSKLRVGGVLAGHDYVNENKTDIIPVLGQFMADRPELIFTTEEHLASWWFIKQ